MINRSQINIPQDKVRAVCRKWKINEFSLFGSVLRDDFDPDSDIDVMVSFEENAGWDLFDLVYMIEELKTIFGREVDLVEKGTVTNPFRLHSIMTTRQVLYAA